MKKKLQCSHALGHYDICIDPQCIRNGTIASYCLSIADRFFIITDQHVEQLYALPLYDQLSSSCTVCHRVSIIPGETSKVREIKQSIEDEMLQKNCGADTVIIAVGGGVVTDLAGFIAATYCRGVPCVYVATSLLAMVDASIGGKTAVNTPHGKNLIGVFAQPRQVFCDVSTLKSLPSDNIADGLVEMMKHALIADKSLLPGVVTLAGQLALEGSPDEADWIDLIVHSCQIKKNIVEQDEREKTGLRHVLNAGHTVAHAIELLSYYEVSHGQAVCIGLWVESCMSNLLGYLSDHAFTTIKEALAVIQFSKSVSISPDDFSQLYHHMARDKKAISQQPQFVLISDIGVTHCENRRSVFTVERDIVYKSLIQWHEAQACLQC